MSKKPKKTKKSVKRSHHTSKKKPSSPAVDSSNDDVLSAFSVLKNEDETISDDLSPEDDVEASVINTEVNEIKNEPEINNDVSEDTTIQNLEKSGVQKNTNKTDSNKEKTDKENEYVDDNKKKKKTFLERLSAIGTVSQSEVVEFTRHISVMINAGITIFEAVKFLRDQSGNKVFQNRLDHILDSLNNGQFLSSALEHFPQTFPAIYVNIIRVGEESGTLATTMSELADHLEESDKFKSRVKGALIYPKIIGTVMFTFIIILVVFVMPRILTIFNSLGSEIPLATRVMIATTDFINDHLLIIAMAIVATGTGIYYLFKIPSVRRTRDLVYLKLPIFGHIVLNYNTAQISQYFGTLFASGISMVKCLEITHNVIDNIIFKEEINIMLNKIKNGAALSQSFQDESHFPPMFIKLLRVGERTGKLGHVIEYMKGYYKGLVDNDVKNITTIIEPLIMVLLGIMVAGLVITVIGPIYQLISDVGR